MCLLFTNSSLYAHSFIHILNSLQTLLKCLHIVLLLYVNMHNFLSPFSQSFFLTITLLPFHIFLLYVQTIFFVMYTHLRIFYSLLFILLPAYTHTLIQFHFYLLRFSLNFIYFSHLTFSLKHMFVMMKDIVLFCLSFHRFFICTHIHMIIITSLSFPIHVYNIDFPIKYIFFLFFFFFLSHKHSYIPL